MQKRKKRHVEKTTYRVKGFARINQRRWFITEFVSAYSARQAQKIVAKRMMQDDITLKLVELYACAAIPVRCLSPDPVPDAIQLKLKLKSVS